MAKSLNRAELIGNVTRDIELKYTPSNTAVVSFSIATNRSWTSNGQKQEAVDYHNVTAWGKLAEIIAQYVSKGVKVYVSGRMQTRKYTDKNNIERSIMEIVADDLLMLSSKGGSNNQNAGNQGAPQPQEDYTQGAGDLADDIPF